ncbi:TIGR04086 family membrane protein [Thalassobacillus hwangdonensis]|uniref:TIGR04086 family membrane protein n=1 Tax=Thalassobacillus hwangdonensis TaxID=546108 RepID=A0ABW3L115_9BACI
MVKENWKAMGYGLAMIVVLMLSCSFVFALLLRFTSIDTGILNWMTLITALLILFIGGAVAAFRGQEKGWMYGLITGGAFLLFVILYQYLGLQKGMSIAQLPYFAGMMAAALIGGMLGVNLNPAARTKK